MNIRLNPNVSAAAAVDKIKAIFSEYYPSLPIDYKFVDDEFNTKFRTEERIGKLSSVFSVLAIFVSCLGVFGLASFFAEQRAKEVGVRKILGASVFNIWEILSKDFVLLVFISCFIAIPAAGYFLHRWLQQYELRTQLSWWIFAGAGLVALLVTLLTVSYHAIKAATTNPVKSLRAE